jgi:microcystin-dependent protein
MSLTPEQITAKNFQKFYEGILPYLGSSVHTGFTPVGTIIAVMGKTVPTNYLACNGQVVNIAEYPELATYFNTQFEASNFFGGNGTTTFGIPDLRGEFLRGTGTNSHTNQGSGAEVGEHQDATKHPYAGFGGSTLGVPTSSFPDETDYLSSKVNQRSVNTASSGSQTNLYYTSRPTNTSVLYCIATKNIFMDAGSNYSTEEQVVGTWIDGKPIYQRIFTGSLEYNSSSGRLETTINLVSGIDKFIKLSGMLALSGGSFYTIPGRNSETYASSSIFCRGRNNSSSSNPNTVFINAPGTFTQVEEDPYFMIVQYTKTTD